MQHLSQRAAGTLTVTIIILLNLYYLPNERLVFLTASSAGELHLGLHLMSFTPWKCLFKAVLSAHGEFKQESSSFSSNFWK